MELALEPEIREWITVEAGRTGISPEAFVAQTLRKYHKSLPVPAMSNTESWLLSQINEGLPQEFWTRYRELIHKRDSATLTEQEHRELVACSDRVEEKDAERMEHLLALSHLRGVSIVDLMQQLGLLPRSATH